MLFQKLFVINLLTVTTAAFAQPPIAPEGPPPDMGGAPRGLAGPSAGGESRPARGLPGGASRPDTPSREATSPGMDGPSNNAVRRLPDGATRSLPDGPRQPRVLREAPNSRQNSDGPSLGDPAVGTPRGSRRVLTDPEAPLGRSATRPLVTPSVGNAGTPLRSGSAEIDPLPAERTPGVTPRGRAFGGTETPALGAQPTRRPTTVPPGSSLPPGLEDRGTPSIRQAPVRDEVVGTPATSPIVGTPSTTFTPASNATPALTVTPSNTGTPAVTPRTQTPAPSIGATPVVATPASAITPAPAATPVATADPATAATPSSTGPPSATATPRATPDAAATPFVPSGTPPGGRDGVGRESRGTPAAAATATPATQIASTPAASPTPGNTPVPTPATATPTPANFNVTANWTPYAGWSPPSGWRPPTGWTPRGGWHAPPGWNPPDEWAERLYRWGWNYVLGRGWVVPRGWTPPPDFAVPPGWYYLPPESYASYGFYNPAVVQVIPGRARPVREIRTEIAYSPPEEVPEYIEALAAPPPRPLPEEAPQITRVESKTEVVEALTRQRTGDRYSGPVLVTESVHFDYDSYAIKPESFPALDAIGESLLEPPLDAAILNIEGHTDADGSDEYNQTLSERRAWSVKSYLVEKFGLDPNRLVIVGFGESAPIATNETDEGKALNRRVEFENVTDLYQTEQTTAAASEPGATATPTPQAF